MHTRIILSILIVVILSACSGGSGNSISPDNDPKDCVEVKEIYLCSNSDIKGIVVNKCTYTLRYIKVVAYAYESKGGELLDSDEEYIEDLGVGDEISFDAVFALDDKPGYCTAKIEEAKK